ncbi:Glycosyl hydrolases family 2, sugar binding domain [Streptomyces sp. YIM 130001]|uniref:glycosylhydrolase-like jelly roll fold domain-containing protein n=1 Tax=Streptomyces sp. YIM 130001 TaxID=2259644 RepID=UPI000EDDAD59|nr:glycosylhydrolase-like jelly roll fold domain-containing protein [Streptomyces sp. YIM 130001]RII17804.1 Glycosyl hydrolases family 2, sugar binding domain [Streptomyces sp. YIM 130001]
MNDIPPVQIVTTGQGPAPSRRTLLTLLGAAALTAGALPAAAGRAVAVPVADRGSPAGRFAEPRADSRPTVLWFWNGTVTDELVRTQLADMRDKGVREVLVFPFQTEELRPAFFSEEWFSVIGFTLREAQRHGMHLWLFNDDYFPSGRAAGLVVGGGRVGDRELPPRPEHGVKGVGRARISVPGGSTVPLVARRLAVNGGRLVVDSAAHDGITLLRDGSGWSDYDVRATLRIDAITAGLVVRSPDESEGLLVELRANGAVDVWRQRDAHFDLVREGKPVDGFDPATDHALTVKLRATRMHLALDGAELAPVEDISPGAGRVGVRATAGQRSSWDTLSVHEPDGKELYSQTFDDPKALDGFALADPAPLVAAAARPRGSTSPDDLIDLTEAARAGDAWKAPAGEWQVDLFPLQELAQGPGEAHHYLDLLDDKAVDLFLDTVPGEYIRRFPWAVGEVLRGFADDEPYLASGRVLNAVPWSASLDGELERLGVRIGPVLSAVHDDLGAEGLRLRGVFWRAVSNRFSAAYYRRQGAWMDEKGLRLISNPLWDEYGPAEQLRNSGNMNTTHQWAQNPGTDLIFDHYQLGYHRMLPRWPASAAHQLGKDRVYLEAMGGTGWSVTPALTREVIGAFAVRGVNQALLHASFSDEEEIVYPPPFQQVNPWWDASGPLNDWIGRLMEACRAPARAYTAVIQPQRAAECLQDSDRADRLDKDFTAAAHALEDRQIDFDLLDEGALDKDPMLRVNARPQGARLVVGRQAYRAAVLPRTPVLALGTAETLRRFAAGGGTVIAVGDLPEQEAGGDDAGLRHALRRLFAEGTAHRVPDAPAAARTAADAGMAAAVVSPHTTDLRFLRLEHGRDTAFVVTNERGEAVQATVTVPASGVPEIWDPDTGTVTPAGVWRAARFPGEHAEGTAVELRVEPKATLLVVVKAAAREPVHAVASNVLVQQVSRDGRGARATVRVSEPGAVTVAATDGTRRFEGGAEAADPLGAVPLDGDWDFRFDRDGAERLTRPLGSWTELDPEYSGAAVYQKTFDLDAKSLAKERSWVLDLGKVREVADVEINGKQAGSRLWAPYEIDVTEALRAGRNTVRVKVVNTGANTRGETVDSGLLGPVLLRPSAALEVLLKRV